MNHTTFKRLRQWAGMALLLAALIIPTVNGQAQQNAGNTATVLVFDTSGSMDDLLATNESKLSAAKDSGNKLLGVIGAENEANLGSRHQVAVVEFNSTAAVNIGFTENIRDAQNVVNRLYAYGGTGMPKGLRKALDLFSGTTAGKSFIILLSDGQPNVGLNDEGDEMIVRQQVFDLAAEAGRRGICIYTIGFGDPASGVIDEAFLADVARASQCGNYHNARDAWELANIYINLRHASTGNILINKSGSIRQGETVDIGTAQVPGNQEVALFTLSWPGSQVTQIIKDPNGTIVDPTTYPGAYITTTNTLVSLIIKNPQPGNWNISAYGAQVPNQTTSYNAIMSVRPNLNPPTAAPPTPGSQLIIPSGGGAPLAVVMIVLLGAGVVVYAMTQTAKRGRMPRAGVGLAPPAMLIGLSGSFAGRSMPVTNGMLIGRSHTCAIRLNDPTVSRVHARLTYAGGQWYIQDLNSQTGVYVNGARVQAGIVPPGAHIRIGATDFQFR